MYDKGYGVPQNFIEAVKWYKKAAEQGNASAQNNLAFLYDKGYGVPQNFIHAHVWYNLAATRGSKLAADGRDNVAKKMIPAQVAEAQQLAKTWWAKLPRPPRRLRPDEILELVPLKPDP